jgi:hypothetical protein
MATETADRVTDDGDAAYLHGEISSVPTTRDSVTDAGDANLPSLKIGVGGSRNGLRCERCRRPFRDAEPVVLVCWERGAWAPSSVCADCFGKTGLVTRRQQPCGHCGRPVFPAEYRRSRAERAYCSPECKKRFWAEQARLWRTEAREHKTCPVCGGLFDGTRKDQVTCSPACRQKAYRQRKGAAG